MKIAIIPLALAFASTAAMAAPETGTINFYGTVNAGSTCPIEVVEPSTGVPVRVVLGHPSTKVFERVGSTTSPVEFALQVTPDATCIIAPGSEADVQFDSKGGAVGPGNDLYKLMLGSTPDLGVAIYDNSDTKLAPMTTSMSYPLSDTNPTRMRFYAQYEAIKVPVSGGAAQADVGFTVNLP